MIRIGLGVYPFLPFLVDGRAGGGGGGGSGRRKRAQIPSGSRGVGGGAAGITLYEIESHTERQVQQIESYGGQTSYVTLISQDLRKIRKIINFSVINHFLVKFNEPVKLLVHALFYFPAQHGLNYGIYCYSIVHVCVCV